MIYLANDKFFCVLTQGYNVGETVLYVNAVPDNVPTILVANKGTVDESVLTVTGKTSGTLIGVAAFPLWLDFMVLLILCVALATLGSYFFSKMEAD